MLFNITNSEGVSTISVFNDEGDVSVLPSTAANFEELTKHLLLSEEHDEEYVLRLLTPALAIGEVLSEVTEGRVTFSSNNLFLDGRPFEGLLASHITNMISNRDENWQRFAKFLIKLDENPSRRARTELFGFLTRTGLQITEEGNFIAYKGVSTNGFSVTSGENPYSVDGVRYNEDRFRVTIPNEVGTTISVDIREVDDDHTTECSYGLHVGSYDYASAFGSRLLTVEVNPANVVTIPREDVNKARVTEYKVIDTTANTGHSESTSYGFEPTDAGESFEWESHVDVPESVAEPEVFEDFEHAYMFGSIGEAAVESPLVLADLSDPSIGHKPFVHKWGDQINTTESSVRRWRKSNGIVIS